MERTPLGVNILPLIGLCPVLIYGMGLENARKRPATKEEMARMRVILREAMDAGCCGWSVQRLGRNSAQRDYDGEPMATDTISYDDLYAFAEELGECCRIELAAAADLREDLAFALQFRTSAVAAVITGWQHVKSGMMGGYDQVAAAPDRRG